MSTCGEIENVEREIAQYKEELHALENGKKSPGKGWAKIKIREMIEESEATLVLLKSV
jgi:sugar-specific transcriptional regulator TrmB